MAVPKGRVLTHPRQAALQDLARSGLTELDFKKLRLEVLTAEETQALTVKHRVRALKLPYLDTRGRDTGFFRLRFLDDTRAFGAKKPLRYWQPSGSNVRAYFAPYVDWGKLLADETQELWFTEGEKKAAAATKAGFPTIGLGGVWNWKSNRLRQPLIPDLLTVKWMGRKVKLAFDTDAEPKPDVAGALEALGAALEQRGAVVGLLTLPLLEGEAKTGLDDFLVARGKKALAEVEVTALASASELLRMNSELAVIDVPPAILHLPTGNLFSSSRPLTDTVFADRRVPGVDSAGRLVELNAVTEWLRWPRRSRFAGLAFEPGQPPALPDGRLNTWKGWAVEPRKGDVSLFEDLLRYQLAGLEAAHRKWFIQWLAYPLQHPGAKLYAAVVLWSRATGTGKTLLGYSLGEIYGEAFTTVTEAELHGGFNEWLANRQLVLGEEVTGSDRRAEADRLKYVVTSDTVTINRKYQPQYRLRNCANFLFTSNHHDAFLIDAEERRYFVVEVGAGDVPKPPERWFTETYDQWYRSPQGAAALFHYLLHVDLAGFDPRARAPRTKDRDEMVEASGSEVDFLVRQALSLPGQLKFADMPVTRDLFTLAELVQLLDPDGRQRLTQSGVRRALRRAGVRCLENTRTERGVAKLWPVANSKRWAQASHAERAAHYDGKDRKE